jgi:16S rRNA (adenine1518-N6/adenine1519-N6)-dimethyltransferase
MSSPHPNARALLAKHGLAAKKSWGQNFLVDERTYEAIVDACALGPGDWVIEIGAGLGTLTARLAERAARVIAIERDRDLVAVLRAELGGDSRVTIAEANALTFDFAAAAEGAPRPPPVAGNLPYHIASQLVFRLLEARARLGRVVIMLQREMAERMVAAPATAEYGALTVMIAMHARAKLVRRVRPGAFVPAPRVESAVLALDFLPAPRAAVADEALFSRVVHAAFEQRRKTLRNALRRARAPRRHRRARRRRARRRCARRRVRARRDRFEAPR